MRTGNIIVTVEESLRAQPPTATMIKIFLAERAGFDFVTYS